MTDYKLIDSGEGEKLEQFGEFLIARPCMQAAWKKSLSKKIWEEADATFTRKPDNKWIFKRKLPEKWRIEVCGIKFRISSTDFGHLGIFPEHSQHWQWMQSKLKAETKVLNLFAHSGAATLALAAAGASVSHVDSSRGMISWARENGSINGLDKKPIRWIVDDARVFLKREIKRGNYYDAIILDPPTFGRGSKGEVFKIEDDLKDMLVMCREVLCKEPLFVLLSCHTPGYTPLVMHNFLAQAMQGGNVECGEMLLSGDKKTMPLPNGTYARWAP